MTLLLLGLNHRVAAVALREQLAIPLRELPTILHALRTGGAVDEAVVLSTCNRIECYVASPDPAAASRHVLDVLAHHSRLDPRAFAGQCYRLMDQEAARHLFRVASGLDSMILGESEVTAQVKQAYMTAQTAGAVGPLLHRLFQKALHGVKIIRTQTRIADGQASIGSIVLALAKQHVGDRLTAACVLLWGAGKAAEATARHLTAGGIQRLWIVNRTRAKAQDLASLCSGGWLSWEQAMAHLAHVDIAVVCTQAPHYVINTGDLVGILPRRAGRPLLLVDLAVPRNVDPDLKHHGGVHLYNIDDLNAIAQTTMTERQRALQDCAPLIEEQVRHCWRRSQSATLPQETVPC